MLLSEYTSENLESQGQDLEKKMHFEENFVPNVGAHK